MIQSAHSGITPKKVCQATLGSGRDAVWQREVTTQIQNRRAVATGSSLVRVKQQELSVLPGLSDAARLPGRYRSSVLYLVARRWLSQNCTSTLDRANVLVLVFAPIRVGPRVSVAK